MPVPLPVSVPVPLSVSVPASVPASVPVSGAEAGEADEDEGTLLPRSAAHSDTQLPADLASGSVSHSGSFPGMRDRMHAAREGVQAVVPVALAVWRAGVAAVRDVADGLGMAWGRRQGGMRAAGCWAGGV